VRTTVPTAIATVLAAAASFLPVASAAPAAQVVRATETDYRIALSTRPRGGALPS
jgi:hypothetical protein